MLTHQQVWTALDKLAARQGLTPSALARRAGLDPTSFNKSKRHSPDETKRPRWPSTESLAKVLDATGATLEDFTALVASARARVSGTQGTPLINLAHAADAGSFDQAGHPAGTAWEMADLTDINRPDIFALEINGSQFDPVYRNGDRLIVAPQESPERGDRMVVKLTAGEILIATLGRRSTRSIELLPILGGKSVQTVRNDQVEWMSRIMWVTQ